MIDERALRVSDRWFRLLQRFYPPDFRDDMGEPLVETYRDRAREALHRGGLPRPGGGTATGGAMPRWRCAD